MSATTTLLLALLFVLLFLGSESIQPKTDLPILLDFFLFNNEPVSYLRMQLLFPLVDFFVLAESRLTSSKRLRQLPSFKHRRLLSQFREKIICIEVPTSLLLNATSTWDVERKSKDFALRKIAEFNFSRFIIVISDADEVPSREVMAGLPSRYDVLDMPVHISMPLFYYNFHWLANEVWKHFC